MSTRTCSPLRSLVLLIGWVGAVLQAQDLVSITPAAAVVVAGSSALFQVVGLPELPEAYQVSLAEGAQGGTVLDLGAGQHLYTAPSVARPRTFHLVAAAAADPGVSATATIWVLPNTGPVNPETVGFPWPGIVRPAPLPAPPVPDLHRPGPEPGFDGPRPMPPRPDGWPGTEPPEGLPDPFPGRMPGREPGVD